MKLGDALQLVLLRSDRSATSRHTEEWQAKKLVDYWGFSRPLSRITRRDVQNWIGELQKQVKPQTVHALVSFLRRTFRVAADEHDLQLVDPTEGTRKPRVNNRRERVLSEEEEFRLKEALPPELWPLVQFAIHTGMRRLEQLRLRVEDIQLHERDGQRVGLATIHTSKTGYGRMCPLNPVALRIFEEACRGARPDEYVFLRDRCANRLFVANNVSANFAKACKKAGLRNLRWHDLRHSCASRALAAGARLQDVQLLLGHRSVKMTERYSHFRTDALWPAALAICAAAPGSRAPVGSHSRATKSTSAAAAPAQSGATLETIVEELRRRQAEQEQTIADLRDTLRLLVKAVAP